MTTLYKLIREDHTTRNGTVWKVGQRQIIVDDLRRPILCTDGVFHAYTHPGLAMLMRLSHANPDYNRLYEAGGEVVVDDGTKVGVYELTLTSRLTLPAWFRRKSVHRVVCHSILNQVREVLQEQLRSGPNWGFRRERIQNAITRAGCGLDVEPAAPMEDLGSYTVDALHSLAKVWAEARDTETKIPSPAEVVQRAQEALAEETVGA